MKCLYDGSCVNDSGIGTTIVFVIELTIVFVSCAIGCCVVLIFCYFCKPKRTPSNF